MAEKLMKFFEFANAHGGVKAKMRLAMMTSIPSTKAEAEPDSPENLEKFRKAIMEITGQSPNI